MQFSVGDRVLIVGVENCAYGYNGHMERLVDQEAVITEVDDVDDGYRIDLDGGYWFWDDTCFELIESEEATAQFLEDLLSII